jgi:chemotaxis protein CheZ
VEAIEIAREPRPVSHKPFRIESLLKTQEASAPLAAQKIAALINDAEGRRLARGAAELASAMESIEKACSTVLEAAERTNEHASELAAAAHTDDVRALARDIHEQMARVFELCHFQDLAGQRIEKVIALLTGLDEHLSGFASPPELEPATPGLINGPRLDGASGHVDQDEIDALFR